MVSRRRTSPAGLLGPQGQRRPSRTPNPRTRLSPHTAVEEHDGGDGDQCREPACAGGPRGALLRSRMYGFLRLLNLHLRFFPSSLRYKRGWRRAFSLFPPGMVQKEADTAYGNIWDALAQAWGFRKGQSRSRRTDSNGRLVKLDGKQAVTAWPASLGRQIGFSPHLNPRALIQRALGVYPKRHSLPGDATERV